MAPVMDDQTPDDDAQGLARNRSRRSKVDKTGRFAALEKFKKAKSAGERVKIEVEEEGNIYDEVDEAEYSDIVRGRQEDDWIVDDDGGGYVEDGREIFDDDIGGDEDTRKGRKKNEVGKGKKSKNPNIRAPGTKAKSIKSMFAAVAVKPKRKVEKDVNLQDDDLLGDIMAQLHEQPSPVVKAPPPKMKKPSKPAVNPFSVKTTPRPLSSRSAALNINGGLVGDPFATKPQEGPPKPTSKSALEELDADVSEPAVTQSTKPSKPAMRTALDDLDDSPPIEEFDSQEDMDTGDAVNNLTANETGMDMADIDFDDDFGQDATSGIAHNKAADVDIGLPEGGTTSWETVKGEQENDIPKDVRVDASQLPLTTNEEGEEVLRFFWLDAYEDHYKQPGVVYLFGKVWIESAKTYVSCCVAVKNIERRVYLLPRKTKVDTKTGTDLGTPVTFVDVYQEFNDRIAEKFKIMKFKSMKVTKQYAFEKSEVPVESDYLEVRYSPDLPQLPVDLKGSTFSHVFGANTSSMELLLIDRKMKGPGWLDIKMPQIPNPHVSWCKVEAYVNKPEYITLTRNSSAPPPLVIMTLNMRTLPNPKTHQNEVIGVACLINHNFHMDKPAPKVPFQEHFCAVGKPNDCIFPFDFRDKVQKQSKSMKVEIMGTERALLGFLLAKIHKTDPDMIVGHDVAGFDLDLLLHRINNNKVPHWSRIGRLKRANMPKLSSVPGGKGGYLGSATCGRLVCDVKISARELIRCRSYDLTELVSHILKEKRTEVDMDQIRNCFNSSAHLIQLIEMTLVDSTFILRLMYDLNVTPLALQITNICGNVMARTLLGGRSERNEYLLLHAFQERNFIVPDKQYGKKSAQVPTNDEDGEHDQTGGSTKKSGRRKPAYAGGLVLEPKKGFYDKFILLLDFNSLYPSIIQEFNICFTTINRTPQKTEESPEDEEDWHLDLPDPDLEPGVLPTEIRKLVESRRQVKQLMKTPDLSQEMHMQYDIRQKALKLTANSMYGCLGFTFSRFYAKPLAALVTGKGREILMKTKDLVEGMNLDVIYGDTDSIMVNSNCTDLDQVFKLGNKIKSEVNKLYRLLEIDIDGVFKSMLLLKKKKYAALNVTKVGDKYVTHQELKGLDIVRRDWCSLAKEAGNYVVSQILSGESREAILENIHSKLIEVGEKVKEGNIPVELYQITKSLTKNPEDYPDKKSLPHVQVALRVNSKGGRRMKAGDTVYYIVCNDGSKLPASQRAYHPDELAKQDTLSVDTQYYLAQQVHPVVARLCDPIDGTDAAHIAECLGLDPTGYRQAMQRRDDDEEDAMLGGGALSEEEKYRDCDRFTFVCPNPECSREIIFDSVFTGSGTMIECNIAKCPNPQCQEKPANHLVKIQNQLSMCVRAHVRKYYEGWLKCEDSACGTQTRKLPLVFQRGHPMCQACNRGTLHPEYSDSALYNQLCFYRYMFDLEKAISLLNGTEKDVARKISKLYEDSYKLLKTHIDRRLRQSAYSQVNLNRLFEGLFSLK